jgi:hypothetical protein
MEMKAIHMALKSFPLPIIVKFKKIYHTHFLLASSIPLIRAQNWAYCYITCIEFYFLTFLFYPLGGNHINLENNFFT